MRSRIQLALGAAVCAAILVLGLIIWMDRMAPVTISILSMPEQSVRVNVTGAVATPGLIDVPAGARLQHVVDAAGGFRPDADLSMLNLAGRVGDGEQINIPSITAHDPVPTAASGVSAGDDRIDINTASAIELQQLPGIGEVLSARIVDFREVNGPFATVDDLQLVDGISSGMVEDLRPLVTVSSGG